MKKFSLVLEATNECLVIKRECENSEIPRIGEEIYLHDFRSIRWHIKVQRVKHDFQGNTIVLDCPCALDDICLAFLKTKGWVLDTHNSESKKKFEKRLEELKGQVLWHQLW